MERPNISKINPKLKVGSDCFLMSISALLEYKEMLSLALTYTSYDFIYNPDYYTSFINPKPAHEYVSKENELLMPGELDSVYHRDYGFLVDNKFENSNIVSMNKIDEREMQDIKLLKELYLDKPTPIQFTCDHYYMYEDYKKKTTDMAQYHTPGHTAVLVDYNEETETCYVIDKFFSFVGEVKLDNFINAIRSEYLEKKYRGNLVQINKLTDISEKERAAFMLKSSTSNIYEEYITINNIKYQMNVNALGHFIENFEMHLNELVNQKGKYAPQFTTKLTRPVRLNKIGYRNILMYLKDILLMEELFEIEPIISEATTLWIRIDQLCDKCYLTGSTIIEYKDRLLSVFREIHEKEKVIFDILHKINRKL